MELLAVREWPWNILRIELMFSFLLASKRLGRQTCNNITMGPTALPCDDTLSLYCSSNYTCQCPSTMFWEINDQQCGRRSNSHWYFIPFSVYFLETKRLYGDVCNGDYYCNETLNFVCPMTPGTDEKTLIPVTSIDFFSRNLQLPRMEFWLYMWLCTKLVLWWLALQYVSW